MLRSASLIVILVVSANSLGGCASSSITPLSQNRAVISTSAAPICRTTGAASVAQKMAAVATLRQGYERFVVGGFGTQNNTSVVTTGPTYSNTTATFSSFGSSVQGSANTQYGGQTTYVQGSNDARMEILMLRPGDAGFEQGLDAKTILGPEWEKQVKDGVASCF